MKRIIKLRAEVLRDCLWILTDEGTFEEPEYPYENAGLYLSDDLKEELENWRNWYEKGFDYEYPPDSIEFSEEEQQAFESKGIEIWKKLKKELDGEFEVQYKSMLNNKVYTEIEDYLKDFP
ncbi:hypothetical protein EHQ31_05165 [Leptospira montravelensis]|uniref:Phage protein n=1 Tax=Leptospira montravelensis TaxID=2484961 RepID=A0ABY2LYA2_9LEPT|nr:hypothetical protein [Leptospira montravelensis]TGK84085.1 hypothetical protein EHQ19_06130 [Leptospira montravelensis]TGL06095.1 hypothetical protein EHQ31_05165 [Leptospira montravelensis]